MTQFNDISKLLYCRRKNISSDYNASAAFKYLPICAIVRRKYTNESSVLYATETKCVVLGLRVEHCEDEFLFVEVCFLLLRISMDFSLLRAM